MAQAEPAPVTTIKIADIKDMIQSQADLPN